MVSRDTVVQAGVGIVAVIVFLAVPEAYGVPFGSLTSIVATVSLNATIFGGAHLILALQGEDGDGFPVRARWRTVALVTCLSAVAFLAHVLFRLTGITDQWIETGALGVALLAIAVYWYVEARDGYRNARLSDQGAT